MMYVLKDVVDIKKDFMIPKTYDFKLQGCKEICSSCIIICLLHVLAPINLHYEFGFQTDEIHDVGFDYILASEFVASQTAISQVVPELSFSVCGFPA